MTSKRFSLEAETHKFWILSSAWRGRGEYPKGVTMMQDVLQRFSGLAEITQRGLKLGIQAQDNLELVINGKKRRKAVRRRDAIVLFEPPRHNKLRVNPESDIHTIHLNRITNACTEIAL